MMSWDDGEQACSSLGFGGHLASILNEDGRRVGSNLLKAYNAVERKAWVGAMDAVEENSWLWIAGDKWSEEPVESGWQHGPQLWSIDKPA
mmetsp:Transcript_65330/g.136171  ORF Transcript_65330/g.136171 Transcript_65330/m.136171 type:complete len:90 (-) Transcript_65330:37-306(-)